MSDPAAVFGLIVTVFIWLVGLTASIAFWAGTVSNKLTSHKERLDSGADRMDEIEAAHAKLDKSVMAIGAKIDAGNAHLARIERQNKQIWDEIIGARRVRATA